MNIYLDNRTINNVPSFLQKTRKYNIVSSYEGDLDILYITDDISPKSIFSLLQKSSNLKFAYKTCLSDKNKFSSYNSIFKGCIINTTGLGKHKQYLHILIKSMGGIIHDTFTNKITHLIMNESQIGKEKYREAIDMGIIICNPKWIIDSFKACYQLSYSIYKMKLLLHMNISSTGCNENMINDFKKIVSRNGGIYNDALTSDVTHLIALNTNSEKYRLAQAWELPILKPKWLYDYIKYKGIININNYLAVKNDDNNAIKKNKYQHLMNLIMIYIKKNMKK